MFGIFFKNKIYIYIYIYIKVQVLVKVDFKEFSKIHCQNFVELPKYGCT
ncbi:MAG: hypothetical protein N7Q72_06210 [Spiroplasma sp. Tabriz.8]|nr:hypothetical protein [Candidatus Phytoplasma australiense]MCZ8632840.1 hypothetical protein [Spiroplasma sp. Tabriz.8]